MASQPDAGRWFDREAHQLDPTTRFGVSVLRRMASRSCGRTAMIVFSAEAQASPTVIAPYWLRCPPRSNRHATPSIASLTKMA
jgi:hypothetical protein